jgi:hypothetical protein
MKNNSRFIGIGLLCAALISGSPVRAADGKSLYPILLSSLLLGGGAAAIAGLIAW